MRGKRSSGAAGSRGVETPRHGADRSISRRMRGRGSVWKDTVPVAPAGPRGGGGGASSRRGRSRDAQGGAGRRGSARRVRGGSGSGAKGSADERESPPVASSPPPWPGHLRSPSWPSAWPACAGWTHRPSTAPRPLVSAPRPSSSPLFLPPAPTVADGAAPPALVPCSALGAGRGGRRAPSPPGRPALGTRRSAAPGSGDGTALPAARRGSRPALPRSSAATASVRRQCCRPQRLGRGSPSFLPAFHCLLSLPLSLWSIWACAV